MPVETTKSFVRRRKMRPGQCARGSFRTVVTGKKHERVVCCPKGHWHPRRRGRKCDVGMQTQSVLTRRKHPRKRRLHRR